MSIEFPAKLFQLRSTLQSYQDNPVDFDRATSLFAVFQGLKRRIYQEPIDIMQRGSIYRELQEVEISIYQIFQKQLGSHLQGPASGLPTKVLQKMASLFRRGKNDEALGLYSLLPEHVQNRLHGVVWKVAGRPSEDLFGRRVFEAPGSLTSEKKLSYDEIAFALDLMMRPVTTMQKLSYLVDTEPSILPEVIDTLPEQTAHWLYWLTWMEMQCPSEEHLGERSLKGLEGYNLSTETKKGLFTTAAALMTLIENALDRAQASLCKSPLTDQEKQQAFNCFLLEMRTITKDDAIPVVEGEPITKMYLVAFPFLLKYGVEKYVQLLDKSLHGLDAFHSIACDPLLHKTDCEFFVVIMNMSFDSLSATYHNYLDRPALAEYFIHRLYQEPSIQVLLQQLQGYNVDLSLNFPVTKAMQSLSIQQLTLIGQQLLSCVSSKEAFSRITSIELMSSPLYVLALATTGKAQHAIPNLEELLHGSTPKEAIFRSIYKLTEEISINKDAPITEKILNDKDLVLKFIERDESFFLAASENLQQDPSFAIEALLVNKQVFSFFPKRLKEDLSFVRNALEVESNILAYTSVALRKNKELIYACVLKDPKSINLVDPSVFEDRAFILELIKASYEVVAYLPETLKVQEEVAQVAIESNGRAFTFFPKKIQEDRGFALLALKSYPELIASLPEDWLLNEAFLEASTKMNGLVLKYLQLSVKEGRQDPFPHKNLFINAVRENKEAKKYVRFTTIDGSDAFKERMVTMLEKWLEETAP